jgi:hypothetical protein
MRCKDDFHIYELGSELGSEVQYLKFYRIREDGVKIDGVTNEEVLEVLIHRLKGLNKKFPCEENDMAIKNLEGALVWLNLRTQDRIERRVEGTHVR